MFKKQMLNYLIDEQAKLEKLGFVPTLELVIDNLEEEIYSEDDGEGMTSSQIRAVKDTADSDAYDISTHPQS